MVTWRERTAVQYGCKCLVVIGDVVDKEGNKNTDSWTGMADFQASASRNKERS